jgi:glycosyltransferase involved in cell wall biosynthesis
MSSNSLHFAVFTDGRCGGALTNVSVSLASGIALQGHTVDIITLNTPSYELINFYRNVDGMSLVNVYRLGTKHTRTSIPSLVQYYRTRHPDVVFSQLTYTNVFAIVARVLSFTRGVNIALEGTLVSKVGEIDAKHDIKLRLVPWLVKLVYPYADGLVAKSHDVLTDVKRVVGARLKHVKTQVLPNPYNIEGLRCLAREPVDHTWLLDEKMPVISSAGRLAEQKGFDILISALAGVVREIPCRLIILGEGPERAKLERLIMKLGLTEVVNMPGWVRNPWKYISRSSFFVLPSRWEGWPSALMEAMACGVPVITTDCPGGGKEMVEKSKGGLIVRTDHIETLKEAMLSLLKDSESRASLSAQAYQWSQNYDYKIVAQDYISFARSLLKMTEAARLSSVT